MSKLYIVPTPIGNLSDITFRAIEVLKSVDLVLAEDTRTTSKLLQHYQIAVPLKSHHIHNEHKSAAAIVDRLLAGESIALVSDAGTPAISDPGFYLVRASVQAGVEVECLPGATALIPALVQSALPTETFHFEGFLPHKKGRQTRLKVLAEMPHTMVLYESPHRIVKTLEQMIPFFGEDRPVSLSRELTKWHEETLRGSLGEVCQTLKNREGAVKGEIVLVIGGLPK